MNEIIPSPFGSLKYIGDLLSIDYPSTVIYINDDKMPVIVEWLDEDSVLGDYYIIYKSTVDCLQMFINGIISHIELIKSADRKIYNYFHGTIQQANFHPIKFRKIDETSLPKKTFYFKESLSDDYLEIAEVFNIQVNSSEGKDEYLKILEKNSEKSGTGLMRLHLNEGINVGFGTVDTKVLGKMLIDFENLYHEVALDVIRGTERNANTINLSDDVSVIDMASTEIYLQEAASFSVYLKTKTDSVPVVGEFNYVSDEIFNNINEVIASSNSKRGLQKIKSNYSYEVFDTLAKFSQTILENKIVVDLDYFNANSKQGASHTIRPSEANAIQYNITSHEDVNEDKIRASGRFNLLNTKTGHFGFVAEGNREFSGYVDGLIRESMISFNFQKLYDVVIKQITVTKLFNKHPQIFITLESCIENEDL